MEDSRAKEIQKAVQDFITHIRGDMGQRRDGVEARAKVMGKVRPRGTGPQKDGKEARPGVKEDPKAVATHVADHIDI